MADIVFDELTTEFQDLDFKYEPLEDLYEFKPLETKYEPINTKVDWTKVHKYYLTNPTSSYRDLSEEFGVSLKQVKKHGSRDGYVDSRQRVTDLTKTKIEENLADERVEANKRHIEMYRQAQALIIAQLEIITVNMEQQCQQAEAEGRVHSDKELFSSAKLLSLTKALTTAINGERVCLSLPTQIAPAPVNWRPQSETDEDMSFEEMLAKLQEP